MNSLEPYCQVYTYDTGNNLTNLSHQANSGDWQQTLLKYLKAGNAFLFSFLSTLISVSVWDAPTKTSELPLKLPAFSILLYSPVSLQLYLPI
jgi:hypothetical protein